MTTSVAPSLRALKVLEALPENIKNLFQYTPNEVLLAQDGMEFVMSQVRTHCGLRPGDDIKDIMFNANDTDRRKGETLSMWLSRCQQNWYIAEGSHVCHHRENMKVFLLRQGARLSNSQVDQYNMLMMNREWNLDLSHTRPECKRSQWQEDPSVCGRG